MKTNYYPGYIEITLKQFLKNKVAVFGVIVVLFLFVVAVYAPFLANNKPIIIKAVFSEKYEDNLYALISNINVYINNHEASKNNKDTLNSKNLKISLDNIENSINRVKPSLAKNDADSLDLLIKDKFMNAVSKSDYGQARMRLADLESGFSADSVKLNKVTLFPAVNGLSILDIFLMLFYPLFIIFAVIKNYFRINVSRLSFIKETVYCLLAALILAVTLKLFFPTVFDTTDYKQITVDSPKDVVFSVFPPVPYGENENISEDAIQKPTWLIKPDLRGGNYHLLGTDTNGRDVLCRMIWGARVSMSVGFIAVGICFVIGVFFGAVSGYFRGWVDISISRLIELVICFPVFFLILTVLAFLRPSIINIMVVIGVTGWTGIARLCRGEFLKLVKQDFVTAAIALGARNLRVIFKHIMPNALGPVLVSVSFGIAGAILTESALSFLGFGVPQPTASWGDILNNGRNDIQGTWWLTIFPGLAIFIAVTAFNLAGEGLRDALDPRLKKD